MWVSSQRLVDAIVSDQNYDPYSDVATPLEAAKTYLRLIEEERSQSFRKGEVDSIYFLKELQDAGLIVAALSNSKYKDNPELALKDLTDHFMDDLDALEVIGILESGDYSQLIW